jgi:hypothetical protein
MNLYGTDIKLNEQGIFIATASGDLETVSELECFIQDIKNEAITYEGDLFYDETYGWSLHDFIQSQDSELTKLEIKQRIKNKLSKKEIIDVDSIVTLISWEKDKISILTKFKVSGIDEELSINISLDRLKVEVVTV